MIILRQKLYSKPNSEKSVNLGGNRVKYKDMTEKQLKNLASYKEQRREKLSTRKGKWDDIKRNTIGASSFFTTGAGIGALININNPDKLPKSIATGALAGLGTWELIKLAGQAKHSHDAKLAKKELEKRGITDWKKVGTLEERNKEVLDDLRRK